MKDINTGSLVLCRYPTHNGHHWAYHYGLVIQPYKIAGSRRKMFWVLVNAKAEFLYIGALSHIA